MKPPPPTPHENGSVTPSTAAAATAASIAFPSLARTSIAAREARRSTVAAAPPVLVDVGGSDAARVGADDAIAAATSAASVPASARWTSRESMRDPFRRVPRHPHACAADRNALWTSGSRSLRDGDVAAGGIERADGSGGARRARELLPQHRERHLVAPLLIRPLRREPAPQRRLLDETELARHADARNVVGIDVDVDAVDVGQLERDARQGGRDLRRVAPPDGARPDPVADLEPAVADARV